MVQHTFSSGVNTNFSSELNDNFNEAETERDSNSTDISSNNSDISSNSSDISSNSSDISSNSSDISDNASDISNIETDFSDLYSNDLQYENRAPGFSLTSDNDTETEFVNVSTFDLGNNGLLGGLNINWSFEIVYRYDIRSDADGFINDGYLNLTVRGLENGSGSSTTIVDNIRLVELHVEVDSNNSGDDIIIEGHDTFVLHNCAPSADMELFQFIFESSEDNDTSIDFDIERIHVWPMLGFTEYVSMPILG